ncbi:MAG: M3 family peptidase [Nevskiaceae bacterium]|nr:MAG: M3 family peptidase [Nevskiaceae bacterium]
MKSRTLPFALCGLLLAAAALADDAPTAAALNPENPFASESALPYALPPFDRIGDGDFRPAFEAGMAQERQEMNAIAANPEAPDFDNTIVAMERAGRLLGRVSTVFYNLVACNTDPELEKLQAEMAPKLAAHEDATYLDPALFARVHQLYQHRDSLGLDAESLRLLERVHVRFVRSGAQLGEADKSKLRQLNAQLATLTTQFKQNVLKATNAAAVVVDNVADLDGLDAPQIAAAAEAAKARGLDGKWLLTLQNTTGQPVLTTLKSRALRERVYRASITRADGGDNDNTAVVAQIVRLRAQRAVLLGYDSHAAYVLDDETARTPDAVNQILAQLAPAAVANAQREAADIQRLIDQQARDAHTKTFRLAPWDWSYYAEQVRKARYAYDESQVKPYFELEHVLQDGVFYAAHAFYGLSFKERTDLPVYRKDVRVFEVFDADGTPMGLFLADYFARDNKRGGAWMNSYVEQSKLFGLRAVVANHLNIVKPPEGQPVLLSFDEVNTMFHEFGHALHGLFSNVRYPYFSGTSVPRDFVEYPSQFNEMWATDPTVLTHYAKHYQTGAAMPQALLDKVLRARSFNQGFATSEYLAAAIVDQAWHQIGAAQAPPAGGVMAFETAALKKAGIAFMPVPPRYHTPYFSHVFAGGYSAAYYAYIWTDVLAADTQSWVRSHGGLQRANGDFLRAKLLSRGGSVDAMTLFREFYGRGPEIGPLLDKRDLILPRPQPRAPAKPELRS